jgi:hypothetical protein
MLVERAKNESWCRSQSMIMRTEPIEYSVFLINVGDNGESLLITHIQGNAERTLLRLPFKRSFSESTLGLHEALTEFDELIAQIIETAKVNPLNDLSNRDKKEWWRVRKTLDQQMAQFIERIEREWLGAFKVIQKKAHFNRHYFPL